MLTHCPVQWIKWLWWGWAWPQQISTPWSRVRKHFGEVGTTTRCRGRRNSEEIINKCTRACLVQFLFRACLCTVMHNSAFLSKPCESLISFRNTGQLRAPPLLYSSKFFLAAYKVIKTWVLRFEFSQIITSHFTVEIHSALSKRLFADRIVARVIIREKFSGIKISHGQYYCQYRFDCNINPH